MDSIQAILPQLVDLRTRVDKLGKDAKVKKADSSLDEAVISELASLRIRVDILENNAKADKPVISSTEGVV